MLPPQSRPVVRPFVFPAAYQLITAWVKTLPPEDAVKGYDLQLLKLPNPSDIPADKTNVVYVASVANEDGEGVLYFRIIDQSGTIIDSNEKDYPMSSSEIAKLKLALEDLWPLRKLALADKEHVIDLLVLAIGFKVTWELVTGADPDPNDPQRFNYPISCYQNCSIFNPIALVRCMAGCRL